jgi:alkylresorcinol/alkylpyrone synthase
VPKIVSAASAVPPYMATQNEAAEFARQLFASRIEDFDRLLPVFVNAGIERRYFSRPLEWLSQTRTLAEKNAVYIESATALSAEAARKAMDHAGVAPSEIDTVIYINSTGIATPSIDARLANVIAFRRDIRRVPVWGLGCAGGVAGIAIAHQFLLGQPNATVLLVATELCGLTFIPDDITKSNIVACALFGEGSAAVVLRGDNTDSNGMSIVDTQSVLYPDSLDVMGWNMVSEGLQVVFAQRIPDIVEQHCARDIGAFLDRHGIKLSEVDHLLFHPGGTKVVAAYKRALGLDGDRLALSESILREYGNMSSATVLFVLERFLESRHQPGYALMSALGPGFSSESALLRL